MKQEGKTRVKIYHITGSNGNCSYYTAQAQANSARNQMVRDDGWVDMEVTDAAELLNHKDEEIKLLEYLLSKLSGRLSSFIAEDVSEILCDETDKWNKQNRHKL